MGKCVQERSFYKRALLIAVPIMIQNGITNFVSLLDNIMVGRVGTEQMTGVAIVNQLMFVFNLLIFGMVSGAGIFGAQFYGNGDEKGLRETFRFKLMSCLLMAVAGIFFFLQYGDDLISMYLRGEGTPEQIAASFAHAKRYLAIMLVGLVPLALSQTYSSTLRETGETMLPMRASVIAVLVNLSLNSVLIFGLFGAPRLGAAGAAVATVAARVLEAVIVAVATHRNKERYHFMVGAYRSLYVPARLVKEIILRGIPLMLNETLWAVGMAFLNQCYSMRGFEVVSAVNISSTVNNLFNVSFIAMGNAIGILIGQLLGAGEHERAVTDARRLTGMSLLVAVIFGIGLAIAAPYFPRIYKTSHEIRTLATSLIYLCACYMPIGALANAFYFTLRSGGKVWVTVLFDSCYVWLVVVPMAYVLTHFTSIGIVLLFACCQFIEIGKCIIGYAMIRGRIWLNKIV